MDLNPYKFEAPWNAWEFAHHVLHREANLVIMSMAWLTREDARSFSRLPKEPDMETLAYWVARLEPLIAAGSEEEVIVIIANRTGIEGDAVYAGTSCVLGVLRGEVRVYGLLGRGDKEVLIVDTANPPIAKVITELGQSSAGSTESPRRHSYLQEELQEVPDLHEQQLQVMEYPQPQHMQEQLRQMEDPHAQHTSNSILSSHSSLDSIDTSGTLELETEITEVQTPLSGCEDALPISVPIYADIRGDKSKEMLQENVQHMFAGVTVRTPDPISRPDAPKSARASRNNSQTRWERIASPPLLQTSSMDFTGGSHETDSVAPSSQIPAACQKKCYPELAPQVRDIPVPLFSRDVPQLHPADPTVALSGERFGSPVVPLPSPSLQTQFNDVAMSPETKELPIKDEIVRKKRAQAPAQDVRRELRCPPFPPPDKALPPLPPPSPPTRTFTPSPPRVTPRTATSNARARSRSSSPSSHRARMGSYSLFPGQEKQRLPPLPKMPDIYAESAKATEIMNKIEQASSPA